MKRYTLAAAAALLVLFPWHETVRAVAPLYSVENLGSFGGLVPTVSGINASGQVAGNVTTGGSLAVRYTDGPGWQALSGLTSGFSVATGINSAGDVVGYRITSAGQLRAFRYRDGFGVQDIAPLPGGSMTLGFGINDAGDVVGYGDSSAGIVAFLASVGLPAVALPSLSGGFAYACGINTAGQAVGISLVPGGAQHGMRIDSGAATAVDIQSFDGPAGMVNACAIDADGNVGGQAARGGVMHAFRYGSAGMLDLDTFGSSASSIESMAGGVSVGWYTAPDNVLRAFAWRDGDGSFDLNTRIDATGWVLAQAKGVNAGGVIAGDGTFNGVAAAFRLTPLAAGDTTPPVIAAHGDETAEATGPGGALVSYGAPSTTDDVDGNGIATCAPASGSLFALGSTTVTCNATDAAGNAAVATTFTVTVQDTTAPVITSVSATPSNIWPPNGKMTPVSISASAIDRVDPAPSCGLTSITGVPASYFTITGPLSAELRAEKDSVYVLHVVCQDKSGNASEATTVVTVTNKTDTAAAAARIPHR